MRKTAFLFSLMMLMVLTGAFGQGGGNGNSAMTLVGTWDTEVFPEGGASFKIQTAFQFGGTATNSPAIDAEGRQSTAYGSWKKEGNHYIHSFYFMAEDATFGLVFIKGVQEIHLIDKNTFEGVGDILLLLGPDPFNPIDTIVLSEGEGLIGRRLEPEGP